MNLMFPKSHLTLTFLKFQMNHLFRLNPSYLKFPKSHLTLMFLMNRLSQMFLNYLKFHLFLNPLPLRLFP
jgi:hypothetical protein